ncbi:hypothetical protein PsorP6_016477 [Peronosclerospora sorghi]|uniref:Uncharacterized protein n=1 Tax=Peronosclerospora sorghi TaxID=230839 RepID=A0ACC0VQD4_9STRA|nr:hypothetical protein PsorP6_016477 [Peronosclerospora sorghi]
MNQQLLARHLRRCSVNDTMIEPTSFLWCAVIRARCAYGSSIVLSQVAVGVIAVEFSDVSPRASVELGRACTSFCLSAGTLESSRDVPLNSTLTMISPLKDIAIATVLGLGCGLAWNKFKDREMDRISRFYKWYDAHEAQKKNAHAED